MPDRSQPRVPNSWLASIPPCVEAGGAALLVEVPAEWGVHVWQALRSVLLWVAEEPEGRGALFDSVAMLRWERELLEGASEVEQPRAPLGVIVGELTDGATADPHLMARACLCVAEWALGRDAACTAVAFAEAGALLMPAQARYALVAGRLARANGRRAKAEEWLNRAAEVARSERDWETLALSLSTLGTLRGEAGDYVGAGGAHTQALRIVRRRKLRGLEGDALHDLFVTTAQFADAAAAEQYALQALQVYNGSPAAGHLPLLAHDVAVFWMHKGQFRHALDVLLVLGDSCYPASEDRILVIAPAAYAAAMCGDDSRFGVLSREVFYLLTTSIAAGSEGGRGVVGSALYLVGRGAWALSRWSEAERVLKRAEAAARECGDLDLLRHASRAAEAVAARQASAGPSIGAASQRSSALGAGLVAALRMVSAAAYQDRRN